MNDQELNRFEEELRRMLGEWVSEEEPYLLVSSNNWMMIGLTSARLVELPRPPVVIASSEAYRATHHAMFDIPMEPLGIGSSHRGGRFPDEAR